MAPHEQTVSQVAKEYGTDVKTGLTSKKAAAALEKYGANKLPEKPGTPLWELVLEQFSDQLVIVLLVSAAISFVLAFFEEGDDKLTAYVEPFVILVILVANAVVGVLQESNAEKAIDALVDYSPDEARVIRDGKSIKIVATDVVPGDLIELAVGDKIPADARVAVVTSASFAVDQALLTGESASVGKATDVVRVKDAVKQDMSNIVFSGTTVSVGSAKAVVFATGTNTAIGDIHESISSQEEDKSPLKKKVDDFGSWLAKAIAVICVLVWVVNIPQFTAEAHGGLVGGAIYYFKIAVALAVAAIPEGLPMVITMCLALGTRRMATKNAIVRNLPSVETLGCTNVICADKTGTLTTNQMSVGSFLVALEKSLPVYDVEGTTFAPEGKVYANEKAITAASDKTLAGPAATRALQTCVLCNNASIYQKEDGSYAASGEPTEAALKVFVEKAAPGFTDSVSAQYTKIVTLDFSRDRKSMSVVATDGGTASLFVKGAPDSVLERSTHVLTPTGKVAKLTAKVRSELSQHILKYSQEGLRVLAFAYKETGVETDPKAYAVDPTEYVSFEQGLVFTGLVAMRDPARPEVLPAVEKCNKAGIRVVMITGDSKLTAETIARQVGILAGAPQPGESFTAAEFDALSAEDQKQAALTARVFSRAEPAHKLRIVDILQDQGLVVAMTGDGVNDAPALKKSSIGVAMGGGTDVAKLASDMVLADNNFATIELAVEEGRTIYENTKQFIRYLISSNIGEVVSIFLTVVLGLPEALLPVQLLWVNLVTDGLPATALGFNPADHGIMSRPPRSASEPLISRALFIRYIVVGSYVGVATIFAYVWHFMFYSKGPQVTYYALSHFNSCVGKQACATFGGVNAQGASTMSLSVLVVIEMFNAMNSLAETESLLTLPVWANPPLVGAIVLSMLLHFLILYVPVLARIFGIIPLDLEQWTAVLAISAPIIVIDEAFKWAAILKARSEKKKID